MKNLFHQKMTGTEDVRRYKAAKRARSKHSYEYWKRHDKSEYRCPDCGNGEGDVRRFEVHHIDGDPLNGDPENLVALCWRCHLDRHGRSPNHTLETWKEAFRSLND